VAAGDLDDLQRRRAHDCRLTPDRALRDLDEAAEWVLERGVITLSIAPQTVLPSLYVACHEEPYAPGKGGFARYPKTRWWWGGALADRPGITLLRIHRGQNVLLADDLARAVDPLARAALAEADAGALGDVPRRIAAHLAQAGPTLLDELKEELGLDTRTIKAARAKLEPRAAVVTRTVILPTESGGHRHTTELVRWDRRYGEPHKGGVDELVVAGVRSAVLAPESEVARWFSWPADVDALVVAGRLARVDGYVTIPASGS
jgi:hypothetical protein